MTTLFLHEMNSVLDTKLDYPRHVETLGFANSSAQRAKNLSNPDGVAVISMCEG
jgi:hypothetical protein